MQMHHLWPVVVIAATAAVPLRAAELAVVAVPDRPVKGEVGCSLFRAAEGFPMDSQSAEVQWHMTDGEPVTCRFSGLESGRYALALSLDENGNRITDTNFLGMPKEAWGTSNNVRPTMRAPRFDEAAFDVEAGSDLTLTIVLKR